MPLRHTSSKHRLTLTTNSSRALLRDAIAMPVTGRMPSQSRMTMKPTTNDTTMVSTTRIAMRPATESAAHASNLVSTATLRLEDAPPPISIARKGVLSKAAQRYHLWWIDTAVEATAE